MKRTLIRAMVAIVLVAGCGGQASDVSDTSSPSATVALDQGRLDAEFDKAFADSGLPGVAVAIWIGDQKYVKTVGFADTGTRAPFRIDDHARIASITKTFTATAILQLVDQGKLSLDDKLDAFVPGIPNGGEITVRNLLSMRSGIYDYTADPAFNAAFVADPAMAWTPQQAVEIMRAHPADFAPDAKTVYCDSNYVLLGLILEKVTGRTASEVINEDVVAKLPGLSGTDFPVGFTVPEPHPTSYTPDPNDPSKLLVVGDMNPAVGWTAGAMTSTVDDLRIWGKELTDGSLLSPQLQRERLASTRIDGVPINVGYGLGVMTINDLVGHNGAILGYSSVVLRLPEADATFVAIGNSSTDESTPTTDIVLALIKELYPDQVQ